MQWNDLAESTVPLLAPPPPPPLVSRSQTLYLEKQRGVKLPWQIGSDHATIFEVLNWIFEVCANHYGE